MQKNLSFFTLVLQKNFTAFCNQKLQEVGLTQGLLYFILYVGKHSGCSTADLIKAFCMDWGHAQRSIEKLVQDGFLTKKQNEHDKRVYCLRLTPKGEDAFAVSHQLLFDWDANVLSELSATEKDQLFTILEKLVEEKGGFGCVRNH